MGSPPAQGSADRFVPGDWNIICSICGTKLKFGESVQNWQGQYRHQRCNEPRHPQDFVHSINSREMAIPVAQKDSGVDVIAPAFPASNVAVTNTFAVPVTVYFYPQGAVVTDFQVNGISIGAATTKATLPAGQTIKIVYHSGYPMWYWMP